MSRRRQLSDEDKALWISVARSIKPMRPAKAASKPASKSDSRAAAEPFKTANEETLARPSVAARYVAPPAKPPPLAPLDRRMRQRVARGREAIDARIDLHGMTQSEAHDALLRFLRRAQSDGAKIAIVVTGKGGGGLRGGQREPGVLRRQVPMWLALPEFRPFIVGFDEAHVSHGGEGALYVRLRRAR
jgi:DNA-nicking Smr family endonuclease